MRVADLGIFAVLGIAFSLLLNTLYAQGIFVDSWIASLGESMTISDLMILNFIVWVILGLFYTLWRS